MSLKVTEKLCVITMKNHTKTEEELSHYFKIDIRNLTNIYSSTRKSIKLFFNGPLVTNVYNV